MIGIASVRKGKDENSGLVKTVLGTGMVVQAP
jgi:hypothetical protein